MTTRIEVTTGARLHFGLLSHAPTHGREYGGVGLMVDSPGFQVIVEPTDHDEIEADASYRARVQQYLMRFRQSEPSISVPACRIHVRRALPPHSGLGSGTQLGMAVSRALSVLAGHTECDAIQMAQRVGRGARSAIGLHGFVEGGFLVDAGKAEKNEVAPLTARLEFPGDWRIVLASPPDTVGLSGKQEERAFAQLPGMPASITNRLHRIVDEQLLPSVDAADFDRFSVTIYEFGRIVGEYFAPEQGGIFSNPLMSQLAAELTSLGIHGIGQSSWGPTLFAFVHDDAQAQQLVKQLQAQPNWNPCRFRVTAARNQGATLRIND